MEATEVQKRVTVGMEEISDLKSEIERLLVSPEKAVYYDMDGEGMDLWIVCKRDEYQIVFDEMSEEFGVGFKNIVGEYVCIDFYGSLSDAYIALVQENE